MHASLAWSSLLSVWYKPNSLNNKSIYNPLLLEFYICAKPRLTHWYPCPKKSAITFAQGCATHDVAANRSTTELEHLPHVSAGSTGHEKSRPTQQSLNSDTAADDGIQDVIVIGTSLIRGLQHRLTTKGAKVKCHMFPGYEVPDIRRELNNILQPQCQPMTIIVQCAGNDIELWSCARPIWNGDKWHYSHVSRCCRAWCCVRCLRGRGIDPVLQHRIDMFK